MSSLQELKSKEEFEAILKKPNLVVVHFYADWAAECQPMNEVLEALSKEDELKGVTFAKIMAEDHPKVSVLHKISAVPTFLFFASGKQLDRLDGANAAKLTMMVKNNNAKAKIAEASSVPVINPAIKLADNTATATIPAEKTESTASTANRNLNERLKKLINQSAVMLFMKGKPENPQCGFSRQAVALLKECGAEFGSFDIFSDEEVRQGLKTYSNWPTYPQLYINGELIGGLDIMKEMKESGDLVTMLAAAKKEVESTKETLEDRLRRLINKSPLMVFMKGDRATPRCGFSRQLVEILNAAGYPYETFDILGDEEVRQGLKTFSNWPTYPQVYVKGQLVGGLDIIKELKENGELPATLQGQ